jgi:uncharacterized protein YjbI with pentapeptide repeats
MWFKKRAKLVLCGTPPKPITFKNGSWKTADPYRQTVHRNWKLVGATVVMFLLTWAISDGAINGIRVAQDTSTKAGNAESEVSPLSHRAIVPQALPYIGARAFAEVPESDLSSRPDSWTGQKGQEVDLVKGASLRKMDLRHANMRQTFLVKADLIGARLESGLLRNANLQQALLVGAQLQRADLTGADLRKADLSQADLQEASLFGTDLREAILPWANLEGADLWHTDLQGAKLSRERGQAYRSPLKWVKNTYAEFDPKPTTLRNAHLRFTDLKGVDLSDVRGLTQEQINQACMNEETKLPKGLKRPPPCPEPEAKKKEKQ